MMERGPGLPGGCGPDGPLAAAMTPPIPTMLDSAQMALTTIVEDAER